MAVRVSVLGTLEAIVARAEQDEPVDLGGRRQRAVLARLLVARGAVVSVDRLVEDVWGGRPPPSAIGALQVHVSHLRRALEPDRPPRAAASVLRSEPPGYAIRLAADGVDAWRFEAIVTDTDARAGASTRAELERALGAWRGPAYAEFADEPWAMGEVARLEELRSIARERLIGAMLGSGEAADAVLTADALAREHPLREEPWRLLALSLYAAGRQADALAALRRARHQLVDELGLDPSPALAALERDILSHRVRTSPAAPAVAPAAEVTRHKDARFVGRSRQLAALQAAADDARGASTIVTALVVGDPGSGKSTLVAHVGEDLSVDGWMVVTGRCAETGGVPPAWPWTQVVRALAAAAEDCSLDALAPLLSSDVTGAETDASSGLFQLTAALNELLVAVANGQPLAILLEDLHRADRTTLELLAGVADSVRGVPLLLVGTTRPSWPGADVPEALGAMAARSPVRVSMTGFSSDEATELVRAVAGVAPDTTTVAALLERTGGNAFYLVESARLLGSEGSLVATSRVPDGVRDVLRRRFALLSRRCVDVLRIAAVIGRDVDVEVLVRVASSDDGGPSFDEETVVGALEAGVLAGLLVEPGPGEVRFAHVVVRETLYDDVPGVRRSRWHARVAAALSVLRPESVAALAEHLYRSGTAAAARAAVDAAVAAADQATARYAPERAVELYGQALQALDRLSPEPGGGPGPSMTAERVELLSRRGRAELAAGAGVAALETRAEAVGAAERSGDDRLIVHALTAWDLPTPWTVRTYGTFDAQLIALLERCLRLDWLTAAERCRLLHSLVREVAGLDQERARGAAHEAEAIARCAGDPVLLGLALHACGVALLNDSDLGARLPLADELLTIGQQPGLAVFALIGHELVVQWALAHAEVAVLADHIEHIDALVRTYRWRQAAGVVGMHRAVLAHVQGDLDAASHQYVRAAEVIRTNGGLDVDWISTIAAFTVAVTRGRTGDLPLRSSRCGRSHRRRSISLRS